MALLDGIDTTPPDAGTQGGSLLKGIDMTPPTPSWGSQAWDAASSWAGSNVPAFGKLLGRTGVHLAFAPSDLLAGGTKALGALAERAGVGGPTPSLYDNNGQQLTGSGAPAQPLPSAAVINSLPLQMDPDAGTAMKTADFVLPFLASGGRNAISRIGEAQGFVNKAVEGLGYLGGTGVDAALSAGSAELGEKYIGGPEGAFIGSLFGGGVRPAGQRAFAAGGKAMYGAPGAGDVYDAMTSEQGPGVLPTFGQVATDPGKQFEKSIGSIPILRSGVTAARTGAEEGIANSVGQGIGALGARAPSTTAVNPDVTGTNIIGAARDANAQLASDVSNQQQTLEDAIGSGRSVDVSPVMQTLTQIAQAPTTGPAATRALSPRIADINELIARQNPQPPGVDAQAWPPTVAYGGLKDLRSDLGARSLSADPLQGHYLGEARDAYTGVMRGAAEEAGQGRQFEQANQDYATFKNVQEPWLEAQGGSLDPGARPAPPSPGTVASRANSMATSNPGYLNMTHALLGEPVASSALADVLSRMGRVSERFTPSEWGKDYAGINDQAKTFIARTDQAKALTDPTAPQAAPYLENAAIGGRAFDLSPERPGLSNSIGGLGTLAAMISKFPRGAVGLAGGIETPSVIRALAGRTDLPALLAQYAIRQGLEMGRQ